MCTSCHHNYSLPLSLYPENEVIEAPSPQYAVLGSDVELQCSIEANGVTIRDTWAVGNDMNFDTGNNQLSSVAMEHEGSYTCRLSDVNEEMEEVDIMIEFRITGELDHWTLYR